ncbi:MAG: type IV secretory system conjugative DNA transfer family protein, partial [Erysipelotrichaceae bacterium]|nr:type IV secretory system conjugative DNA transfer family protein [Erysipelotrichaceae bacterium]
MRSRRAGDLAVKATPSEKTFYVIASLFLTWFLLKTAPYTEGGLLKNLDVLNESLQHPFSFSFSLRSLKIVFLGLALYAAAVFGKKSSKAKTRRKEEYGSAEWGDPKALGKKYADPSFLQNKILSENMRIGFDTFKHRRNLNTLIIGGSGAGKTRFYGKPNIMQANTSFVILDPKGEILRDTGHLLKKEGYVLKVVDLIEMKRSHGYNPFRYLREDKDILKLITNLIRNTTPKGSSGGEAFWERSETALLQAIFLYLFHEAPEEEQNFGMVTELLSTAEVREEDEEYESALDRLFNDLEDRKPGTLAYKQYRIYKQAAGKTAKSILVSVGVRLAAFNLAEIVRLTSYDELELEKLGERKTALFAIIPDNDTTFNFLIGMLYTQLFQMLYHIADEKYGGALPIPVHFLMDEFANVALPDEFDKLLSTMRSRNIFVSIILQNLAQLKALYKDSWESIVGNCDELCYLGGNEQSTHKFLSEYLGKETLEIQTHGRSSGRGGNFT